MEALGVHRRGAAGQGRRHPRPRPDRRAGRRAAGRVRHEGDRLRPVPGRRPGPRSWASAWSAWTSCSPRPTSSPCTCRRTPRQSGSSAIASCTRSSPRSASSTPPAAASSTRPRSPARCKEGRVAGAGIDVYAKEPCTDSPLFGFDNVVVTPHLGRQHRTRRRRRPASQVARSVRLALDGEFVPDAVNVQGGAVAEDVRPGLPLAEKLGRIFTALAGGSPPGSSVEVRGEIAALDVSVLELAALKGVFGRRRRGPGDLRQRAAAGQGARRRGQPGHRAESPDWRNVVTVRGVAAGRPGDLGRRHAVRAAADRAARRGQRLRDGDRPGRAHGVLHLHRPAGHRRHGRPDPRRRSGSTSPACRSAGTPRAATR